MGNYKQLIPIDLERKYGNNWSRTQLNQGSSLQLNNFHINQIFFSKIQDLTASEQILEALHESQRSFEILLTLSALKGLRFCGQRRIRKNPKSNSRCGRQNPPTQ